MTRIAAVSIAAALCLFVSGMASAAPKETSTCAAGVGKPVCCKAGVANHCNLGTSCCERGNKAFFTASDCSMCAHHRAEAASKACAAGAKSCDSSTKASAACDTGNRGFFTAAGCAPGAKSPKSTEKSR